jgi:hypothetical protein
MGFTDRDRSGERTRLACRFRRLAGGSPPSHRAQPRPVHERGRLVPGRCQPKAQTHCPKPPDEAATSRRRSAESERRQSRTQSSGHSAKPWLREISRKCSNSSRRSGDRRYDARRAAGSPPYQQQAFDSRSQQRRFPSRPEALHPCGHLRNAAFPAGSRRYSAPFTFPPPVWRPASSSRVSGHTPALPIQNETAAGRQPGESV